MYLVHIDGALVQKHGRRQKWVQRSGGSERIGIDDTWKIDKFIDLIEFLRVFPEDSCIRTIVVDHGGCHQVPALPYYICNKVNMEHIGNATL